MRKILLTLTTVVGLGVNVACFADDYSDCLKDNADRADKKTYCFGVVQQKADDARDKAISDATQKAKTQITQDLTDTLKKQGPAPFGGPANAPSTGASSGASSSAASSGSSSSNTETETPSSSDNTTSSSSSNPISEPGTSKPSNTSVKPAPKEKPTGVQWY